MTILRQKKFTASQLANRQRRLLKLSGCGRTVGGTYEPGGEECKQVARAFICQRQRSPRIRAGPGKLTGFREKGTGPDVGVNRKSRVNRLLRKTGVS